MILHKFEDWYTSKEYANFILVFVFLLIGWLSVTTAYLAVAVGWIAPTLLAGHPHTVDDGNVIATMVLTSFVALVLTVGSVAWLYELEEHRIDKAKELKQAEERHIRQMERELGFDQPPMAYPVQYVPNNNWESYNSYKRRMNK